jgi:hypothetical protein
MQKPVFDAIGNGTLDDVFADGIHGAENALGSHP